MKKVILMSIILIGLSLSANANRTATCRVEGVPGAHVTVEILHPIGGESSRIHVQAFGVTSPGAVQVVITDTNGNVHERIVNFNRPISGGFEGIVTFHISRERIRSVEARSAVCH